MPECCIVYLSDQAYLFPTLVSAIQARRFSSVDKADVVVCLFGVDRGAERDFAPVFAGEGIRMMAVDESMVEGANPMMARLFLNRFLPAGYTQYLYIDGDVHITGSLDPLIDADVPAGRFLAANDPMTFMLSEGGSQSRDFTSHMAAIGLDSGRADAYFNTGVLRINRAGWDDIGLRAWNIARAGAANFRFPDQDPLNIAAQESRMPMSLAWNFPIFMRNARVESTIKPCMYHFMSNPKPWQGAFAPWNAAGHAQYVEIIRRYPWLAPYNPALPRRRRIRYKLQQLYKQVTETVTWGFGGRRSRILRYEARMARVGTN
jgi:lipopolysaccharide biosynthesis glycosyltransferase